MFGGGGFTGQSHQTNKQNREMLKKHKKDQKQFLSGIDMMKGNDNDQDATALTLEQRNLIESELEMKKRRQKIISSIVSAIIFGAMILAILSIALSRATGQ